MIADCLQQTRHYNCEPKHLEIHASSKALISSSVLPTLKSLTQAPFSLTLHGCGTIATTVITPFSEP